MKRVGIFLAYNPDQPLRKEGLGRLLAFFIKGAIQRSDFSIVVACPRWYRDELAHLFSDHDIDPGKVEILTTAASAYVLRLREWMQKRSNLPRQGRQYRLRGGVRRLRGRLWKSVVQVAVSTSVREASREAFPLLGFGALIVLAAIGAVPLILLERMLRLLPNGIRTSIGRVYAVAGAPFSAIARADWMRGMFAELRKRELDRLVAEVNAKTDMAGWLVPNLFWPEVTEIKTRTVVVAPDIVFFEFPTNYGDKFSEIFLERALLIAERADHFITYSEYVKDSHLVKGLGVAPDRVSVIRHGRVSLADYLRSDHGDATSLTRDIALSIVDFYQQGFKDSNLPWTKIDFKSCSFVFYSSQLRPHKNILTLIKAIEYLNRVDGVNVRLLLTANLYHNDRIVRYVQSAELGNIVLAVHDIPSKLLAAFACLSSLAVTPTFFEGGFPFTFCEAFSVGTPSILSDIPVIREVIGNMSPELQKHTLFDPGNVASLKSKLLWGLAHRKELFELQRELYDAYPTWQEVAGRYLKVVAGDMEETGHAA